MCTVTLIGTEDGVRLACNRDELRTRPAALPPRLLRFGARHALMPIDPVSGGTWIAVSDAGLVLALLNVNRPEATGQPITRPQSRGGIIPALLAGENFSGVLTLALALDPSWYIPFRLVLAGREGWAELYSNGHAITIERQGTVSEPVLLTSSGLGDELVQRPRQNLFRQIVRGPTDLARRQEEFHRHSWPARLDLSVCMRRPDARTVSYTVAVVSSTEASMTYYPDAPDQPVQPTVARLALEEKAP